MREKAKEGTLKVVEPAPVAKTAPKRRGRWDMTTEETPSKAKKTGSTTPTAVTEAPATPAHLNPWDATPGRRDLGSETPGAVPQPRMWDPTPAHATPGHQGGSETPAAGAATPGRRNRWVSSHFCLQNLAGKGPVSIINVSSLEPPKTAASQESR